MSEKKAEILRSIDSSNKTLEQLKKLKEEKRQNKNKKKSP
jgi:hypothetical protein